jgi:hypothetical protein
MDAPMSVATVAASRAACVVFPHQSCQQGGSAVTHENKNFVDICSLSLHPLELFIFTL